MKSKTICYLCLLLIFCLLITACKSDERALSPYTLNWATNLTPLPEPVTVKVGMKQVMSDAGILIGMAKGYYASLGIRIEPVQFNSGQEMINQLAAGQLEVGATVTSSGLFNAMSRNIPVKIVADKGYNLPGKGYYRLVVRKDLASAIQDYRDLKGRKIAVVGSASLDEISLDRVLNQGGLTTKDVDLQVIRSFPDMLVALGNGSIDAAMVIEPFITKGIEKNLLDPWKDPYNYDPDAQTAILVFGPSITSQPDVANRFMTAYIKSVRDYNDAFLKDIKKDEIITILTQYSVLNDPALYEKMLPTGLNPQGYLRLKGLNDDLNWYKNQNLVAPSLTLEQTFDHQYVDFALEHLPHYTSPYVSIVR